ncbi:TadE family type IV pilus minor pilin [Nocardioides sp.]|uniref:TadE family type IV pilus minor pilin n=1 Tax=Nocardioides sp. TaxID=35761 RepID=UPI002B76D845|nr:TadE family type IV pilus minor pilin [Nocardioides sp.]HXH81124.1 TadE family type IV pilus minor pilin [Nocardioides sp.]
MTGPRRQERAERGAVTAELALALPLLLAVTVGLVWLLAVGAAQVRVVDSAREAARAVARGDDQASARSLALGIAPEGASVDIAIEGGQVTVTSSAEVEGPGGLFDFMADVVVSARSVALMEQP